MVSTICCFETTLPACCSRYSSTAHSRAGIEHQIAQVDDTGLRRIAPRQRPDAGHEFGCGEGFDQVVVGARLEAAHPVFDGVTGREQQHRRGVAARTQAAHDFEAVDAGQADIEHRHLGGIALQLGVGLEAVDGQFDLHAMALQGAGQAVGQDGIVFDE
jgi:hypothetical protein